MKISFVIAVYQNEGAVTKTHEKIADLFRAKLTNFQYEIIFVNDGSTDASLNELLEIKKRDSANVVVIDFTRNFGQMAAMLAGFQEASGDAIVNISADLQDPISLVEDMVNEWKKGAEIVVSYRSDRTDSFSSKLFSRIAYSLLRLSNPQIPKGGFDFVLMSRKVMNTFNSIEVRNRFFQGDLLWPGYKTVFFPYVRLKRTIGKSQYNFSKKLKNFLDAFLDASYLPIRAISVLGFLTSLSGLLYSATIVYAWMRGSTPFQGWAPLMMVTLFVGGVIMLMLGVIGEYVWRIYEEVRKRPNYVIKEKYS